jgi:hypothetical protein
MNRPATLALLAALGAGLSACGLNQEGVRPPDNTISFPSAARLDPNGQWLYFVNSNADLRYNDGTAMVLDVKAALADRDEPRSFLDCTSTISAPSREAEPSCCWDLLDREVLNCDERRYILPDRTVRLGSYAAGMVLQQFCPRLPALPSGDPFPRACPCDPDLPDPPSRLLIAVRGDTSLTVIDLERPDPAAAPVLRCTGAAGEIPPPFGSCDEAHRIVETVVPPPRGGDEPDPEPVRLPDEPYALVLDSSRGLLFLGHLTGDQGRPGSGGISLFDVAPTPAGTLSGPRYLGPIFAPFAGNMAGLVGVTSLTWDPSWEQGNAVYATSRYLAAATGMRTINADACATPQGELNPDRDIAIVAGGNTYGTNLAGEQTRGIQNVLGRTFLLQRNPPAVVGFSGTTPADVLETCSSPTYLYKYDAGAGPRLYVSCQDAGEVYVYDPAVPRIERVFQVGRGPAGLEFADRANGGRPLAFVVGFGDNNISVVDLLPGSPTEYHVIQRIGYPSTVPR